MLTIITVILLVYVYNIADSLLHVYVDKKNMESVKELANRMDELIQRAITGQTVEDKIVIPDDTYIRFNKGIITFAYKNQEPIFISENCLIDWSTLPNEGGTYQIRIIYSKGKCKIETVRIG
jgi:hypothetical protein